MATNRSTRRSSSNNDRPEANGFLNLFIVDKNGNEHRIKAVVPLFDDNNVHEALLAKADAGDLQIVGRVNLNTKSDVKIEL